MVGAYRSPGQLAMGNFGGAELPVDPLNPSEKSFFGEYDPPKEAVRAHEVMVLRSTNQFVLPFGPVEWKPYYFGLIGVPAMVLGVACVFFIVLCVEACCRCPACRKRKCCSCRQQTTSRVVGFSLFVLCVLMSLVAWGFSFDINRTIDSSLNSLLSIIETESQAFNVSAARFSKAADTLAKVEAWTNSPALFDCPSHLQDTMAGNIDLIHSAEKACNDAANTLSVIATQLDLTVDFFESVTWIRVLIFDVCSSVMFFATTAFLILVSVTFLVKPNAKSENHLRRVGISSCVGIYSLGLAFICFALLITVILWPVTTMGADICVPDPSVTIQRVISESTDTPQVSVNETLMECVSPQGVNASSVSDEALLVCYFQTCITHYSDNVNKASLASSLLEKTRAALKDAVQNGTSKDITEGMCKEFVDDLTQVALPLLADIISHIVSVLSCVRLHYVYISVVHDTLCDKVVPGLFFTWHCCFVGSWSLLFAVVLYQVFDLAKNKNHQVFDLAVDDKDKREEIVDQPEHQKRRR